MTFEQSRKRSDHSPPLSNDADSSVKKVKVDGLCIETGTVSIDPLCVCLCSYIESVSVERISWGEERGERRDARLSRDY